MAKDSVRELISRTIDDVEALVYPEPGEIFIDVPADEPQYIRVEEGDTIQEGDIRSHTEAELESPSLGRWTVERIGRKTVVGTDQDTGERREWVRQSLEKQLAIGGFSTELTDFDRVTVTGGAKPSNHEGQSEREAVILNLYGNDGQEFTQTYRLIDERAGNGERHVELTKPDKRVETFENDLRERFDRAAERALRDEGYTV